MKGSDLISTMDGGDLDLNSLSSYSLSSPNFGKINFSLIVPLRQLIEGHIPSLA